MELGREIRGVKFTEDSRHGFGDRVGLPSDPTSQPTHTLPISKEQRAPALQWGGVGVGGSRRAGSPRCLWHLRLWSERHLGKEVRAGQPESVCPWADENSQSLTPRNGSGRVGGGG